jgi:hypothetical protein
MTPKSLSLEDLRLVKVGTQERVALIAASNLWFIF